MSHNSEFFTPVGPFDPEKTVLIVDDMPMMRNLVKEALLSLGFKKSHEEPDGASAWNFLEKSGQVNSTPTVQLIVSDFNMPKLNGIDLLEKVRGSESLKKTPFVLLTTQNEEDIILRALELKANNFIIKPFITEDFKKKLAHVAKTCHG